MTGPGTLLLVTHTAALVSAILLPPTNIKISSRNFQHILTWDDPNNQPGIFYSVDYAESGTVSTSRNCSRLTSRQCDLTKDFTKMMDTYTARVWSSTHNQTSEKSSSMEFTPISNTVIGPAQVSVVPCDHCITVSIQPPVSHLWSEKEQRNVTMLSDDVYPLMSYTIHLNGSSEVREFSTENESTTLNLSPNANYCVSVSLYASLNLADPIMSDQECVVTGPTPQQASMVGVIIPVVCGVLVLSGIVLLLIGLDRAGYICMKRKFFPKVLKSLPESESNFCDGNNYVPPICVDHVEIMEQKVEVEESKNEDKQHEGGYKNRRKLMDSGEASSGPNVSGTSSSEASGQTTSSSEEESLPVDRTTDLILDSEGSGSSGTPLLAHAVDSSTDHPINGGVFNVNLNSVSLAIPVDVWTDPKSGGALTDEPCTPINSCPAGLSLNIDNFPCSPIGLGILTPTVIDVEQYDNSEEEDLADNSEDCDDQPVSGYMRRGNS